MDSFHPDIRRALEQEETAPAIPMSRFTMYRDAIHIVLGHSNSPEKDDIITEIERDLQLKYEQEEISLHEKLSLQQLLWHGKYAPYFES